MSRDAHLAAPAPSPPATLRTARSIAGADLRLDEAASDFATWSSPSTTSRSAQADRASHRASRLGARCRPAARHPGMPAMSQVVRLPVRSLPGRLITKRQLANELGRSTRWVELRMREGMPVAPRSGPHEHARFDLEAVRTWLESRSGMQTPPLEQRVAQLERQVSTLVAELKGRASACCCIARGHTCGPCWKRTSAWNP